MHKKKIRGRRRTRTELAPIAGIAAALAPLGADAQQDSELRIIVGPGAGSIEETATGGASVPSREFRRPPPGRLAIRSWTYHPPTTPTGRRTGRTAGRGAERRLEQRPGPPPTRPTSWEMEAWGTPTTTRSTSDPMRPKVPAAPTALSPDNAAHKRSIDQQRATHEHSPAGNSVTGKEHHTGRRLLHMDRPVASSPQVDEAPTP